MPQLTAVAVAESPLPTGTLLMSVQCAGFGGGSCPVGEQALLLSRELCHDLGTG